MRAHVRYSLIACHGTANALAGWSSDALQRQMGWWWRFDVDRIARANPSPASNDRHDAGLPNQLPVRSTVEDGGEQPGMKARDLNTRVPQTGHLQFHVVADAKQGMPR